MSCETFFDTCIQKTEVTLSNCKVAENKASFMISSTSQVQFEKIKFDECNCPISKPLEKRCDWIIHSISNNTLYFIELKGADIVKALEQLENSVKIVKPQKKFECHIVKSSGAGGIPSFSTKFQVIKKKIVGMGGDIFKPHSSTHIIKI